MMIFCEAAGQSFRAMTFNIRYDNPSDADDRWDIRREGLIRLVVQSKPDIIGFQEVLKGQLQPLVRSLKGYDFVGVGRDDGHQRGEFVPLFFSRERFKPIDKGYFWLSETPGKPGKGWDAACERMCCWWLLQDRMNGKKMLVLNAHLDHMGANARMNSVSQIVRFASDKSRSVTGPSGMLSVILMGDFNLTPEDPVYPELKKQFSDAYAVSLKEPSGPSGTFNGFITNALPEKRIDYFWTQGLSIIKYECVDARLPNGRWPSDHCPVLIEAEQTGNMTE